MVESKRHKKMLYSIVVVLLILQIASFVFLSLQVSRVETALHNELATARENIMSDVQTQLAEYNLVYQQQFNDIARVLAQQAQTQEGFAQDITTLKSSQDDFSNVVEATLPGVVSVMTERSVGTGFVVDSKHVITNYHVIKGARRLVIVTSEKERLQGTVVGVSQLRDLALIRVASITPQQYPALSLADSNQVRAGQTALAIGNPLGLSFSVTEGIISAVHRPGPNGLEEYIQTDVPLNPGNSGGPLINRQGDVIGINNFKIGGAEGLGFALESNSIQQFVQRVKQQQRDTNATVVIINTTTTKTE